MLGYTWIQWLFFFFFYSFFGWCFESTYVSLHEKRFVNRGFIRGPFLPLYGTGALMMLIVSMPFQDNLILTYVAGCVGATVLEYITGVLMETLFKVRYWDYSHKKFNFQGQICLESSLAWGFLTILMTRMIHKPIEAFALWLPSSVLTGVTMVVTVIFAADFALSFKAALDLRDVLVRMEQAKDELEKMQRRLDVILAVSEENWENRKKEWNQSVESTRAGFVQRRDELVSGIEKRFERAKELEFRRVLFRSAVRPAFKIWCEPTASGAGLFPEGFHKTRYAARQPEHGFEEVLRSIGRTEEIRCGI